MPRPAPSGMPGVGLLVRRLWVRIRQGPTTCDLANHLSGELRESISVAEAAETRPESCGSRCWPPGAPDAQPLRGATGHLGQHAGLGLQAFRTGSTLGLTIASRAATRALCAASYAAGRDRCLCISASVAVTGPVRVGLVGYGMAGRDFHAPLLRATEGLTVAQVVTGNPERAESARAELGARVVSTFDDLLAAADELDLVVLATPTQLHA